MRSGWWPGAVPAGAADSSTLIAGFDIPSTLRRVAGLASDLPDRDRQDLSAALLGEPVSRQGAVCLR